MPRANNNFNYVCISLTQLKCLVLTRWFQGQWGSHDSQTSIVKLHRCSSHRDTSFFSFFFHWWGFEGWLRSCFESETYGATVNAALVFSLLWLPVKSQSMTQEDGACQYQPMMSWERKWVGLNGPQVIFTKSLWNLKTASAESDWRTRASPLFSLSCVFRYVAKAHDAAGSLFTPQTAF